MVLERVRDKGGRRSEREGKRQGGGGSIIQ